MNDRMDLPEEADPFSHITEIANGASRKVSQRGLRRAIAVNAVQMAREHADRASEPFSQSDADVIMYITELLNRVASV